MPPKKRPAPARPPDPEPAEGSGRSAKQADFEEVDISSLIPWAKNPRQNDQAVARVAASIRRFGFVAPIIANRATREVCAGHTRLKAAQHLGRLTVPVRWVDLSPADAHAYALADNRLGELAEWDPEGLAGVLRQLRDEDGLGDGIEVLGWDAGELGEILGPAPTAADIGSAPSVADDAEPPEPPATEEEADSVRGQVYELGPHRLLCGDSTEAGAWARVLLPGERLQMAWTDPPYGVSVVGRSKDPRDPTYQSGGRIENDDLSADQLREFLRKALSNLESDCVLGAVWYVAAPPGPLHQEFGAVLLDLGIWRQTLIWVKQSFVFGRSDYHYRHEPIFYGWTPGGAHRPPQTRTLDSVLEADRPMRRQEHPTTKPIKLVQTCIENSSDPGWIVGDPFGGSGTTLLAAAACGRVARLIELSPRYCDVIRRRWTIAAREAGQDPGPGALG